MKRLLISAFILGISPTYIAIAQDTESGLEAWNRVYEVFSHPRCTNCHVGEDGIPVWSGPHYGEKARAHGMYVAAGESRIGVETLPCETCHMKENSNVLHGAPGAEVWHLPPASMEWFGKSSQAVCEQIKDPERNGERTLEEVADHVDHDPLVAWGWEPGPGREPAPHSASQTKEALLKWISEGAPCPAD